MDNLYRDFILEHYREPHNRGVLEPHDLHFADSNPTCGDELSMTLRLDASGEAIADVAFDGRGCAISQASACPAEVRAARLQGAAGGGHRVCGEVAG